MSTLITIQDVSRRSGLSGPTLRYYEEIGLIGPIARDASSGHRRYREEDLDALQALARRARSRAAPAQLAVFRRR
jgi:MerR family copper efflux transcriptional regulator